MAEELHIHDDLPISAGTGWMQMESLLNKAMPVKQKPSVPQLVMACLPALLLSGLFIFSSLKLGNQIFYITAATRPAIGNAVETYTNKEQHAIARLGIAEQWVQKEIVLNPIKMDEPTAEFEALNSDSVDITSMDRIDFGHLDKISAVRKNDITISSSPPLDVTGKLKLVSNIAGKKLAAKQWEVAAGVAMNMSTGKHQNLQPYPIAEVKYNISQRFFVAAGLSFLAPKPGNLSGVSKTIYVNDTPSNIRLYNNLISYERLRYADVPITAGINIGKRLSLQAGLQVSVLASKRRSESLQPYDFQMNNVDMPYSAPLVGMAANPEQDFKLGTPTIDYRFTSSIKYNINTNISTGVSYQHNLPANKAWKNNTGKVLFSFNVMYKIK